MAEDEQGKKISQLIAKCWSDESFKQKFMTDPAAILKAEGIAMPAGVSIKAVEDTGTVFHFVIPPKPAELSDEELDKVAGGEVDLLHCRGSGGCGGCGGCYGCRSCRRCYVE